MTVKAPGKKAKPFHDMLIISGIMFPFFLYTGIQMGKYAAENPRMSFFAIFSITLDNLANVPHLFSSGGFEATYLLVMILVWGVIVFMLYEEADRNKRKMPGKEKGGAKWNDGKEYNKMYSYPKGDPEFREPTPEEKLQGAQGNIIISQNVRLNQNWKETQLNDNILIDGMTGSGKTFGFVKPNVFQANASYVITDPSGELVRDVGYFLLHEGYSVKIFNTSEMEYSCRYNPFRYIRNDEGVMVLVNCMMKNTDDSKANKGDQFFVKAEQCLFLSLFYYIYYEEPKEKQNMQTVLDMLAMASVDERNADAKSELDRKFDTLAQKDPSHVAVRNYNIFKQGTGKTLKSILISAGVRLAPFTLSAVRNLTSDDTLDLENMGESRCALFIITKAEDDTFNFLAAMMYTQLFEVLYYRAGMENPNSWLLTRGSCTALRVGPFRGRADKGKKKEQLEKLREHYLRAEIHADDPEDPKFKTEDENGILPLPEYQLLEVDANGEKTGKILRSFQSKREMDIFIDCLENGTISIGKNILTTHVSCILDEFANTGEIPGFIQKLSTMRKYDISAAMIVQSLGQIKTMYEDDYRTLISNCSTLLFLGSVDKEDSEYFSEMLGDTTIETNSTSRSYGRSGSSSVSQNVDSAPLMRPEDVRAMPREDCLVIVSGQDPFYDKKAKTTDHENSRYMYNPDTGENFFDYRSMFFIKEEPTEDIPFKDDDKKQNRTQLDMEQLLGEKAGELISGMGDALSMEQINFALSRKRENGSGGQIITAEQYSSIQGISTDDPDALEKIEQMVLENLPKKEQEEYKEKKATFTVDPMTGFI